MAWQKSFEAKTRDIKFELINPEVGVELLIANAPSKDWLPMQLPRPDLVNYVMIVLDDKRPSDELLDAVRPTAIDPSAL